MLFVPVIALFCSFLHSLGSFRALFRNPTHGLKLRRVEIPCFPGACNLLYRMKLVIGDRYPVTCYSFIHRRGSCPSTTKLQNRKEN